MTLRIKHICLGALGWMALTTSVVSVPNVSPWLATPFVLVGLIFVIGVLLSLALRIRSDRAAEQMLYSIGLGLSYVLIGGLVINWLLPYVGVMQPLAKLPLVVFFDISAVVLAWLAYHFNKECVISYARPVVNWLNIFFGFFPLVFLVMSICGAEILNNGGSGTLTLVTLFGIAAYVIALMIFSRGVKSWVYISALYFIGLALLFMYSLRSLHIPGWDINQEYEVFQLTLQHLRWSMSYYPGQDYNACLSITLLPTIFKVLTNMPSEYIFKVAFQFLFALTPVMVFVLAKRYVTIVYAFLAAFLLLSQTWFFEQMPALIRQEVAFVFYLAVLLVIFDLQLSKRSKYIVFCFFTVGLVLSHYSTAYLWLTLMFGVLFLSYVSRLTIKSLRHQKSLVKPMMFILSLVCLVVWQYGITHTGSGAVKFATNDLPKPPVVSIATSTASSGQNSATSLVASSVPLVIKVLVAPVAGPLLAVEKLGEKVLRTILFSGGNINTDQNLLLVQQNAIQTLGKTPTYSDALHSAYVSKAVNENVNTIARLPYSVSVFLNGASWISKILLIDIFSVLGIAGMYVAWRRRPTEGTLDFILLSVCSFGLILLILFIPYIQVYYNISRLYLQMFLVLSIFAIFGGLTVTKYVPKYQKYILTAMVVLAFFSLNGALDQFTGGEARITFAQPKQDLDKTYIYDTEVAGAQWLALNQDGKSPIQADVVANLRLRSFADKRTIPSAIFPQTIDRTSYVYLNTINLQGFAFAELANNELEYNYPIQFVDNHKALIYTNNGSRIYK